MASGQTVTGRNFNKIAQYTTASQISHASQTKVTLVTLSLGPGNWLVTYNTPLNSHAFATYGRSYVGLYADGTLLTGSVQACRSDDSEQENIEHSLGASIIYRNNKSSDVSMTVETYVESGTTSFSAINTPVANNYPTIAAVRLYF